MSFLNISDLKKRENIVLTTVKRLQYRDINDSMELGFGWSVDGKRIRLKEGL